MFETAIPNDGLEHETSTSESLNPGSIVGTPHDAPLKIVSPWRAAWPLLPEMKAAAAQKSIDGHDSSARDPFPTPGLRDKVQDKVDGVAIAVVEGAVEVADGVVEVTAVDDVEVVEVGVPSCVADEQAARITADTRMPRLGICLRMSLLSGGPQAHQDASSD